METELYKIKEDAPKVILSTIASWASKKYKIKKDYVLSNFPENIDMRGVDDTNLEDRDLIEELSTLKNYIHNHIHEREVNLDQIDAILYLKNKNYSSADMICVALLIEFMKENNYKQILIYKHKDKHLVYD